MIRIVVRPLRLERSVLTALLLLLSQTTVAAPLAPDLLQTHIENVSLRSFVRMVERNSQRCEMFSTPEGIAMDNAEQEPLLAMACFASAVERQGLSAVDGSIEAIAQLFLQHGLVEPVHQLLSHAQNSGRRADQARLRFWLARYALETKNWTQAQRHKAQITNRYSLSADQQDYLSLMRGVLLQLNRQHRHAIALYENFSENSPLYPVAQANLALAYISQGWWTDAYREIDQLLARPMEKPFHNRLRITKGLSQLQQGFYRDARKTFRSVDRDSRYTGNAWLGIGLAALHLNDHPGALNAFQHLRATAGDTVDAHALLVAYTYERMGELVLAEASYTEAIAHYQNQINRYDARLSELSQGNLPNKLISDFDAIAQVPFFLGQDTHPTPPALLRQYRLLVSLSEHVDDMALRNELNRLQGLQKQRLAQQLYDEYQRRREQAQSYLSQSQYGLATVYDH